MGEKLRCSHGFFERRPVNNYVKTRRVDDGVLAPGTTHACRMWPAGSCRPDGQRFRRSRLTARPFHRSEPRSPRPSSSGQDTALSRREQGFDSPWARHPLPNISLFRALAFRRGTEVDPATEVDAAVCGPCFAAAASGHSNSVDRAICSLALGISTGGKLSCMV
jgi:hypothetical protein